MSRAIIDADTYIYKASVMCKELVDLGNGIYYEAYNINKAREYLTEIMKSLTVKVGCTEYVMVTGGIGKNFRYLINPQYKSNRKQQAKPLMLDLVRDMCFKEFPMVYIPCLEADDTCRILLEEDKNNVVVSIDKDLRTFSGKIYDSYHDKFNYISPEQAEANFKRQLLIGDKVDGFSGLRGIGKATADKLLLEGITIDEIAELYVSKGYTLDDFELVYNCAKILGKEDYKDGIITLYGGKKLDVRNNQ